MIDNLVENQGGLHARITCQIYLRPFTLNETEQYLQGRGCLWDRFQIAQCYMFFGGVPFYLSLLDTKDSLTQNVDRLCFARGGALRLEFDELYNALFTNADKYVDIVRLLAERRSGMTSSEIAKTTSIDGRRLAKMLKNLERCDSIMKFRYYGKNSNDVIYKLTDFYTLFYIKYIEIYKDSYDEQWWQHNATSHSVESWQGLTFELLCLMHIRQIRQALNIGGVATEVSAWFDKADKGGTRDVDNIVGGHQKAVHNSQIDLIIERADRIIHLCEMKFSQSEYRITADYEEKLRNIIADIASKDNHDPKDGSQKLTDRQKVIIEMIIADPFLSAKAISEKMSEKEGTNERTIERDLAKLKKHKKKYPVDFIVSSNFTFFSFKLLVYSEKICTFAK